MKEFKFSNSFRYDPLSHVCRFDNFDEQIARVILFNEVFEPWEFESKTEDDTYYSIQDLVQEILEEAGFSLGAEDANKALVNSVYNLIYAAVCEE